MTRDKLTIIAIFIAGFIALGAFGLFVTKGCQPGEQDNRGSFREMSEDLPEPEVTGSRTKANVIANMKPVLLEMQRIYRKHLERNRNLRGQLDLKLTVEWTGEIGSIEIARSTLSDQQFERAVLLPVECFDFDGWAETEEDTEILYPIAFG